MKKTITFLGIMSFSIGAFTQEVKTAGGGLSYFKDDYLGVELTASNGAEQEYQFILDANEKAQYHGDFKAQQEETFTVSNQSLLYSGSASGKAIKRVSGKYNHGKKEGVWKFEKIQFDAKISGASFNVQQWNWNTLSVDKSKEIESIKTITVTYVNDLPEGEVTENVLERGVNVQNVKCTISKGHYVGQFTCNSNCFYSKVKRSGKFDNKGFFDGEWGEENNGDGTKTNINYSHGVIITYVKHNLATGEKMNECKNPIVEFLNNNKLPEGFRIDTLDIIKRNDAGKLLGECTLNSTNTLAFLSFTEHNKPNSYYVQQNCLGKNLKLEDLSYSGIAIGFLDKMSYVYADMNRDLFIINNTSPTEKDKQLIDAWNFHENPYFDRDLNNPNYLDWFSAILSKNITLIKPEDRKLAYNAMIGLVLNSKPKYKHGYDTLMTRIKELKTETSQTLFYSMETPGVSLSPNANNENKWGRNGLHYYKGSNSNTNLYQLRDFEKVKKYIGIDDSIIDRWNRAFVDYTKLLDVISSDGTKKNYEGRIELKSEDIYITSNETPEIGSRVRIKTGENAGEIYVVSANQKEIASKTIQGNSVMISHIKPKKGELIIQTQGDQRARGSNTCIRKVEELEMLKRQINDDFIIINEAITEKSFVRVKNGSLLGTYGIVDHIGNNNGKIEYLLQNVQGYKFELTDLENIRYKGFYDSHGEKMDRLDWSVIIDSYLNSNFKDWTEEEKNPGACRKRVPAEINTIDNLVLKATVSKDPEFQKNVEYYISHKDDNQKYKESKAAYLKK